ncbi:uncharacterized protein LOC143233231 [Tachypleus tridentatus]|uniref:uncharacterized protein LOC143233231 n=1 Tax=Tachypleus tridentatus TaxID=6853 RepID=UPI003FD05764
MGGRYNREHFVSTFYTERIPIYPVTIRLRQSSFYSKYDELLANTTKEQEIIRDQKPQTFHPREGRLVEEKQQDWSAHHIKKNNHSLACKSRSVSSLEDGTEESMSLTHFENLSKNAILSGLEYTEKKLLLKWKNKKNNVELDKTVAKYFINGSANNKRRTNKRLLLHKIILSDTLFDLVSLQLIDFVNRYVFNNFFLSIANYNSNINETSSIILEEATQTTISEHFTFFQMEQLATNGRKNKYGEIEYPDNQTYFSSSKDKTSSDEDSKLCPSVEREDNTNLKNILIKNFEGIYKSSVVNICRYNEEYAEEENVTRLSENEQSTIEDCHETVALLKTMDFPMSISKELVELSLKRKYGMKKYLDRYERSRCKLIDQKDRVSVLHTKFFTPIKKTNHSPELSDRSSVDIAMRSISSEPPVKSKQTDHFGLQEVSESCADGVSAAANLESSRTTLEEVPTNMPLSSETIYSDLTSDITHGNFQTSNKHSTLKTTTIQVVHQQKPSCFVAPIFQQDKSVYWIETCLYQWAINNVNVSSSLNNNIITNNVIHKNMTENIIKPLISEFNITATTSNKEKPSHSKETFNNFDVCNIETAIPVSDQFTIECNLTDWYLQRLPELEKVYCRLTMDSEMERSNLTRRLQHGMNLQICFMNEMASDWEGQGCHYNNDYESLRYHDEKRQIDSRNKSILDDRKDLYSMNKNQIEKFFDRYLKEKQLVDVKKEKPSLSFTRPKTWCFISNHETFGEKKKKKNTSEDLMTKHVRLQAEARLALAQAKKMAKMQIEVERQRTKMCTIRGVVGFPLDDRRYKISKYSLSDMNLGQLQMIVSGIYRQIENLNEELVELLLERDSLHMEQDAMLVDIEDLTRYYVINSCCSTFAEASKHEALQSGQTTLHSKQMKLTTK